MLLGVLSAPGFAQQQTTATFDDWVVRCEVQGEPPKKFCDMSQVTKIQGQATPLSRVSIVKGTAPVRLTIQVPVNVSLKPGLRVQTSASDAGMSTPFARCVPAGCFAEFDLRDTELRKLRAAAAGGKISFVDSGERNVDIPISFKGFERALDAMNKE